MRTLIRHAEGTYEERVTLWWATSLDDAVEQAEGEVEEHVEMLGAEYLGLAQAYGPIDEGPIVGAEVFSLIRDSDLSPQEYLKRFFTTGTERQQHAGKDA